MSVASLSVLPLIFAIITVALLLRALWSGVVMSSPMFLLFLCALSVRSIAWFVLPYPAITALWTFFPIVQVLTAQESLWHTAPWITEHRSRPWVYSFCWSIGILASIKLGHHGFRFCVQVTVLMTLVASMALLLINERVRFTEERFAWHQAFLALYAAAGLAPALIPDWFDSTALTELLQIVCLAGWHRNLGAFEEPGPRVLQSRSCVPAR